MAQDVDIIDLRRSYIPIDPQAYPNTYHHTEGEDNPENRIPVIPYDGYNFMPTPQGYASFFGTNSRVDIDSLFGHEIVESDEDFMVRYYNDVMNVVPDVANMEDIYAWERANGNPGVVDEATFVQAWLPWQPEATNLTTLRAGLVETGGGTELPTTWTPGSRGGCDDIFMIQTRQFENRIVALCEDGIWTKSPTADGEWTQEVVLDIPESNLPWSKCVIDNVVYAYRQSSLVLWIASPQNNYRFEEATPTGINMAGQLGIFKAGGRLSFWDSENSTGWSSLVNTLEFGNADELSGFTIFQDIVGRIVVVLQHGDGFIIYATKSIVHVVRNPGSAMLFQGKSIFNNNGISYRREAAYGDPDTLHFAFTTQGLAEIHNGQAQIVMAEIGTYLKEKRQPVLLQMLNGRYLHFQFLDPYYLSNPVGFSTEEYQGAVYKFDQATRTLDKWNEGSGNVCRAKKSADNGLESYYLNSFYGYLRESQATALSSVPIFTDVLRSIVQKSVLDTWKDSGTVGIFGSKAYFNDKFEQGGITKIDAPLDVPEFFVPRGLILASAFSQAFTTEEPHDPIEGFYLKQEMLWLAEEYFTKDWEEAIKTRRHQNRQRIVSSTITRNPVYLQGTRLINNKFGPYIDLSFFSESNRYYGSLPTTAWLQRSLTRGINVIIPETRRTYHNIFRLGWIASNNFTGDPVPAVYFGSYAAAAGAQGALQGHIEQYYPAAEVGPAGFHATFAQITYDVPGIGSFIVVPYLYPRPGIAGGPVDNLVINGDFGEIYNDVSIEDQIFGLPRFEYEDFDPCVYEETGYTKISGHGHYNLFNEFFQDDALEEALTYIDQCEVPPKKKKLPYFNGQPVQAGNGFICSPPTSVTIGGEVYTYPAINDVAIPGGEIFLQDGSYEPLYPTFIGSFVFDVQYKKWGKLAVNYKHLLDFFPINNVAGDGTIPYDTFLPKAAALFADGFIYPFDQYPLDSKLVVGKYGTYRKGYTDLHEIKVQHRTPFTCTVSIEGSIDGRLLNSLISKVQDYVDTDEMTMYVQGLSARWFNITVEGNYDIIHLEARSSKAGRR